MGQPHGIGIVGAGVISGAYLETLADHPGVRIAAIADLDPDRAAAAAARAPGATATDLDGLLADPSVQTVLNLTIPAAHADVARAALTAGKDVYGEKPLAADSAAARQMAATAAATGHALGCAPDTVLGTGVQTARAAIEDGVIGPVVSATATWLSPGHEHWHPNPDFYYLDGGGPLLDMGPYYLTALVHLLGPVESVQGASRRAREERVIGTGPRAGERIPVQVDTHVTGVLTHVGGALSTVAFSFDAVASRASHIEVHGQDGVIQVPDPNGFDGPVRHLRRYAAKGAAEEDWETLPVGAGYEGASRGIGLLDFIAGHRRANGALALHVLDIMSGLLDSATSGQRVRLESAVAPPALVPFTPAVQWRASV